MPGRRRTADFRLQRPPGRGLSWVAAWLGGGSRILISQSRAPGHVRTRGGGRALRVSKPLLAALVLDEPEIKEKRLHDPGAQQWLRTPGTSGLSCRSDCVWRPLVAVWGTPARFSASHGAASLLPPLLPRTVEEVKYTRSLLDCAEIKGVHPKGSQP